MNTGAARAARADRRQSICLRDPRVSSSVPRELKRFWAALNHRQRGKIRRRWKDAQRERVELGLLKWRKNHEAAQAPQSMLVSP